MWMTEAGNERRQSNQTPERTDTRQDQRIFERDRQNKQKEQTERH